MRVRCGRQRLLCRCCDGGLLKAGRLLTDRFGNGFDLPCA
jgi:hypothetical protein